MSDATYEATVTYEDNGGTVRDMYEHLQALDDDAKFLEALPEAVVDHGGRKRLTGRIRVVVMES